MREVSPWVSTGRGVGGYEIVSVLVGRLAVEIVVGLRGCDSSLNEIVTIGWGDESLRLSIRKRSTTDAWYIHL